MTTPDEEAREQRVLTMTELPEDGDLSHALRPKTLAEFIGQARVKEKLSIYVEAAIKRREVLDHCVFYGPPGLGKTTLAHIIAHKMGGNLRLTSGPAIERPGDLAALLSNLNNGDILFIDEIHRLNPSVEEILYPAMEDFALDIILGKGPMSRNVRLPLQPFTLVAATTRLGLLTGPLRSRFGIVEQLDYYSHEELTSIIKRSSVLLGIRIDDDAAGEVGSRARGTPRIANRLLRRVRDFAQVKYDGYVTLDIAREALKILDVDESGLDLGDRRLLELLVLRFSGGPVGLGTLAASLGEEIDTLEDIYEPYLLREGFLERTPRGRKATARAFSLFGVKPVGPRYLIDEGSAGN